ncbi:MAG: YesL family protein [Oscillospiraceae bacterium]|nr:YesL family protein [Oscillospiraceae bacterium]
MSLFYNPQKSGRGVSKDEVRKSPTEMKPFFRFFEIFGRKFWYITQLNIVYLLLCIPIVTIGPATAAMTHVMRKFILEQPIFVFSEFWSAFKKHFKRTCFLGIVSLSVLVASAYSIFAYSSIVASAPSFQNYFMLAMGMVSGSVFLTINTYVYPQIICLDLPFGSILKNSAILCLVGFKRNVFTVVIFVSVVIAMIFYFPFSIVVVFFAPFSWLAFLCVFNSYPAIQKFIIAPFYEKQGLPNPEIPDFDEKSDSSDEERGKKTALFTDLGGQEIPINKKKVKPTGKIIK